MELEFYLALLQLHIAVIGVILAGVIALVQLLSSSKPRRNIGLLATPLHLTMYGSLLVALLVLLGAGSWANAFPADIPAAMVDVFASGAVGLFALVLMMISLGWFVLLALRTKVLLDSQLYLRLYVRRTPARDVRAYTRAAFGTEGLAIPPDPFQPIREYIKDNAFKYYDYGTADGLKHFSRLFDKALADTRRRKAGDEEYERLARYISESCEEFFRIFSKTASEKRKSDIIELLCSKGAMLLEGSHDASHASLLPIVHGLEAIAKASDDDDEVIAAIQCIRRLADRFLDGHKTHDWAHIAGIFDEICLAVSRMSETYYLHKNNSLKTVPIVGYATGEHHTVTTALVRFFVAYQNLSDRHTDATPGAYFEAIEGVLEVLFIRLGDIVQNGQQQVGFNMRYHAMARELYQIYFAYGLDAIQHGKPELLTMALSNLRRIIKPAKTFKLAEERQQLTTMIVELAARGVATLGDIVIKSGDRTIADYAVETLHKHATNEQIALALDELRQREIDVQSAATKRLLKRLAAA